jgi:putative hydrolase of the HAD superfamily
MNNVKHIFFDLDHTLWDFEKNSQETLKDLFFEMELNLHIESFERFMKKYREINNRYWNLYRQNKVTKEQVRNGRFKDTLNFFKLSDAEGLSIQLGDKYITISPTKTNLFPNTHQILSQLKQKYQLHIITNGFKEVQHTKLEKSNLIQYFDVVVCSEESGKKKPHKDVFNLALTNAKTLPKESLMVGDNLEADIIGANKVGMKTIWFNPGLKKTKVEVIQIKDLSELSSILWV